MPDPITSLAAMDDRLALAERRSLDPSRTRATCLRELGISLLSSADPSELGVSFAEALCAIASAISQHFPENIFWDLDFLAASLLADARSEGSAGAERLRVSAQLIVDLQASFGQSSSIRFRYVHDFVYGFDWARWVSRAPSERRNVGPYSQTFCRRMQARAGEIAGLIASDDRKYPKLASGEPRNPFGFSREPKAERSLHEDLAKNGLLPVPAWHADAKPEFDRPYSEFREQRARELGLLIG